MTFIEAVRKRDPRAFPPAMLLLMAVGVQAALLTTSMWLAFISVPIGVTLVYLAAQIWQLPDDFFDGDTK